MRKVFKENSLFFYLLAAVFIPVGIVLMVYSKLEIHLLINSYHSTWADWFFKVITDVGDGWFAVILTVVLLFFSYRKAFILGGSVLIGGVIAQILKRLVFADVIRPLPYFMGKAELYLVPDVHMRTTLSLPSGHTAAAFAMFFAIAFFTKKPLLKFIAFLFALLIGYSRMYLSQHFLIDVFLGAIIGTIGGVIGVYFVNNIKSTWIDKSIIKNIIR